MKPQYQKIAPAITTAGSPDKNKDQSTAGEHFGSWKFNLHTGQLSLSPGARNLLGLAQGGNYRPWEILRRIDPKCFQKAKAWIRASGQGGVLEELFIRTDHTRGKPQWIKITGFHYAERWEKPTVIIGAMEDFTQNVDEERIALAIVNHELRTPLSVMKLKAQMLQRTDNPINPLTHTEMAKSIETQIENIAGLLDHYLTGAAVSAGLPLTNTSLFDLNQLTAQILNDIKYLYKGHRFIHTVSSSVLVNADKYQIMQVLINYLTNAAKYSPEGSEIKIDISADQQYVLVKVTDHGPGIEKGLEKRVFERFYRAENPAIVESGSKGLGLYLVRQIIERHNGKVWAQRGLSDGTEFFFKLPKYGAISKTTFSKNPMKLVNGENNLCVKNAG